LSAVLERDRRFTEPLYTVEEAAEYLRLPRQTLATWVRGYQQSRPSGNPTAGEAFIHAAPKSGVGRPEIPFIGLAEGMAARAMRDIGVSTREIRQVLPMLERELGIEYALASRRLYFEGRRILFDYATTSDRHELAVFVTKQGVLAETLAGYMRRLTFDAEGYASRLVLPGTEGDVVEVDPEIAFGKPTLVRGNARMVDVLDRFAAGDSPREIANDFEIEEDDVTEVIRVFYCRD
jgi:uncharacterized protein (DUF433 family)